MWAYDFVQGRTHDSRAFRMLTVFDEYMRERLAIEVDRHIRAGGVLHVLTGLFTRHGAPDNIRSDNGSEFTAKAVRDWLPRVGMKTLYIEPGSPWENGLQRELQRQASRRAAQRRDLLFGDGGKGTDRTNTFGHGVTYSSGHRVMPSLGGGDSGLCPTEGG